MSGSDSKVTASSFGSGMHYVLADSISVRCDLTFHIALEWFWNSRIRLHLRFVEERQLLSDSVWIPA